MIKRSLIVASLTLVLVISAVPIRPVQGVLMTPEEVAMLDAASLDTKDTQSKSDNGFVRVLKAPFKAIGRIFGIGGNKDDGKPQRLSRKDVKKFESVGTARVIDARTTGFESAPAAQATTQPAENAAPVDPRLAAPQENLERGRALLNSGNVNDAIAVLSTAATSEPNMHEAYSLLGVAYEAKGMRDRAFDSFEKALKADQHNPEYLNNLGYLHFKNGDYDTAAKYLKRAVKTAPNVQRYWNNLGLVQAQRAKWDDAYECFLHAVGEYEGHMNVANRSQAMGYDKTAIKHLEQARALKPATAEILLRLAVLYKRTGNDQLAAEANTALTAARSQANNTKE
jgi:Flp pilus assembly protein TadD